MLATPVFGFSLAIDFPLAPEALVAQVAEARLGESNASEVSAETSETPAGAVEAGRAAEPGRAGYGETMKKRAMWVSLHRPFGVATWGAMLMTVVLGAIQYYNLYGFWAGQNDNPCARDEAIFGPGQCFGPPWPHRIAAWTTTALYATTMTFSFLMPDPGGLDEGNGIFARKLRTHKILRWVHFGGMIAQIALGILSSNAAAIGLDRANHYAGARVLATVHQGLGWVTFGAMTWAAATMIF